MVAVLVPYISATLEEELETTLCEGEGCQKQEVKFLKAFLDILRKFEIMCTPPPTSTHSTPAHYLEKNRIFNWRQ